MNRQAETEYRRYTAVLREDNTSFAITPTKRPRGKVTIEINANQGLLKCAVKNLRPPRAGEAYPEYGIWLYSDEKGPTIPVYAGVVTISEEGIGERDWEFKPGNSKEVGLDIESFNIVKVCVKAAPGDDTGHSVIVGQLELEEANLSEEPKMEKVSPFGSNLPHHQWWKFYPGYFQDWTDYPIQPISQACSNFLGNVPSGPVFRGHQLVGLQYDQQGAVKFLVHGIPGRFCLRDQPYGGSTGYLYWHPLPGQKYTAGEYGYWLVYIDPVNGEVVYPKRATRPPDCDACE